MRSGEARRPALWLGLLALAASGCRRAEAQTAAAVVLNECATGPGGWIELLNRGGGPGDLAKDPANCWLVDDVEGGGAPKVVTDANVNHLPGSTTCASFGRPASCAIIAPGEHVWVKYAFINSTTPDACRLLIAARTGSSCGAATDTTAGGPTASTVPAQCFGRQPDGAGWASGSIPCTQGATNGGCLVGAACDDGNACTSGETFSPTCACTGGTPRDGTTCGAGRVCQAGACVAAAPGTGPVIVHQGSAGLLLVGTLVTPDATFDGEVLIVGEDIQCAAASCSSHPAASSASIVQTNGIIFPGLIDTHNHIQFDIFDESDWAPEATDNFTNHDQWPARKRYQAMVNAKQYLNGEEGSPVNVGCELVKYGELKGLIAGTTSIVGAAIQGDKKCYGSLARTIDQRPNGLPADKVQAATLFPRNATDADKVCANMASGKTDAYLIHIAEGVDQKARDEFQKLFDITTTDGCLFSAKTSIVHGTALLETHFSRMHDAGMGLVWSPRSNVFLYGHGTDLSKTTNIPAALERGITVALAPDWSIGGSQNLLDELRFADQVDNSQWGDTLTPKALVQMATRNPARLLGLATTLGQLAEGMKADIAVIGGDRTKPYEAILASTPKDVRLVLVGGKVLYGDASLRPLGQTAPECDALNICGANKFACVAQEGGTAADKLGDRFDVVRTRLATELKEYDDKNLSDWDFSPIADLYKCGP